MHVRVSIPHTDHGHLSNPNNCLREDQNNKPDTKRNLICLACDEMQYAVDIELLSECESSFLDPLISVHAEEEVRLVGNRFVYLDGFNPDKEGGLTMHTEVKDFVELLYARQLSITNFQQIMVLIRIADFLSCANIVMVLSDALTKLLKEEDPSLCYNECVMHMGKYLPPILEQVFMKAFITGSIDNMLTGHAKILDWKQARNQDFIGQLSRVILIAFLDELTRKALNNTSGDEQTFWNLKLYIFTQWINYMSEDANDPLDGPEIYRLSLEHFDDMRHVSIDAFEMYSNTRCVQASICCLKYINKQLFKKAQSIESRNYFA